MINKAVISFPKSGRSWLRYGLYLAGDREISFHHDGFEHNNRARPPLNFDITQRLTAYADLDGIVYLERDPRDTIVSLFYQITGRFRDMFDYRGSLSDFLRDPHFGIANLLRFQSMWRDLSSRLPVLVIRYEEMAEDYAAVMLRVSNHLDLGLSPEACASLAELASFQRMQEVESSLRFPEPWLRPRLGSPKVRQGKVGTYRDELSPKDSHSTGSWAGLTGNQTA
jgi:hypothetical protein